MFQSSTVGGLAGNSIGVPSCHGLAKNATRSSRSDGLHQRERSFIYEPIVVAMVAISSHDSNTPGTT